SGAGGTAAGVGGSGGIAGTAGIDASGATGGAAGGGGPDGGGGAAGTGTDSGIPLCPQYTTLVTIGADAYCVDWWEVMNGSYQEFLDDGGAPSSLSDCAGDTSRTPTPWPFV